jgi:hypothetical protein
MVALQTDNAVGIDIVWSALKDAAVFRTRRKYGHKSCVFCRTQRSGLPRFNEKGYAQFVPFADLFPTVSTPIPEGKNGWILFLDEFNSASRGVQAACYKLILDRMTGQVPLHENVVICAAGNLSTDKAITNPISTAMQSRVIHLQMEINFTEWLLDVALKENYDSRIIAYLSQYPNKLMDFDPDHNEKTFCCPRTWEFMNKLTKDKEVSEAKASLYSGTITSGVAVDFIQFTKVYATMVNIRDIMANPQTCPVPYDTATKWAVMTHMMELLDEHNFDKLSIYVSRFSMDFRVLFFRSIMVRKPELRHHKAFISTMGEMSKYLYV